MNRYLKKKIQSSNWSAQIRQGIRLKIFYSFRTQNKHKRLIDLGNFFSSPSQTKKKPNQIESNWRREYKFNLLIERWNLFYFFAIVFVFRIDFFSVFFCLSIVSVLESISHEQIRLLVLFQFVKPYFNSLKRWPLISILIPTFHHQFMNFRWTMFWTI